MKDLIRRASVSLPGNIAEGEKPDTIKMAAGNSIRLLQMLRKMPFPIRYKESVINQLIIKFGDRYGLL